MVHIQSVGRMLEIGKLVGEGLFSIYWQVGSTGKAEPADFERI